eukprot:759570-Hanusia_phi.AAC.6
MIRREPVGRSCYMRPKLHFSHYHPVLFTAPDFPPARPICRALRVRVAASWHVVVHLTWRLARLSRHAGCGAPGNTHACRSRRDGGYTQ